MATGLAEQSGHGVPIIVSDYGKEAFSFDDGILKVTIKFAYEPDAVFKNLYEAFTDETNPVDMEIRDELKRLKF